MVERHIMQAQARAVCSDEREAHRLYSAVRDAHPAVYIPPGTNVIIMIDRMYFSIVYECCLFHHTDNSIIHACCVASR
jgi:hypothetical protein